MSDHTITSLIEKLEVAEVGSRELSDQVLSACGYVETRFPMDSCPYWVHPSAPKTVLSVSLESVTTSLDAALALAERVLPEWHVGVQPWFHADPDRVMSRAYLIRPDWKRWNPTGDEWCDQHHGKSCHTAALAVVSVLLRAQSEALIASQEIDGLRMEIEDCEGREQESLIDDLLDIQLQISTAIAKAIGDPDAQ